MLKKMKTLPTPEYNRAVVDAFSGLTKNGCGEEDEDEFYLRCMKHARKHAADTTPVNPDVVKLETALDSHCDALTELKRTLELYAQKAQLLCAKTADLEAVMASHLN